MDPAPALLRLGGVAGWTELRALASARGIRRAVRSGEILRVARNRYTLPTARTGKLAAARLHGVATHLSAAAHWGWELKTPPDRPHVTVPRGRKVSKHLQDEYVVHWADLDPADLDGSFTSPIRTVLDCARTLPFEEALAVADSALRHGLDRDALCAAAALLRGPGAARARLVLALSDKRAANPFESVLRALAIQVGLNVEPQRAVAVDDGHVYPDLVDGSRRLVIEGDSWTWHSASRWHHNRDCERYNDLVVAGWLVLRFTYEHVMNHPGYVLAVLDRFVDSARLAA